MSPHDEFNDLKKQLRQNRPATEPMPSDLRIRVRHQLMEKAQMKQKPLSFGMPSAAAALLILILLPALFWVWQSNLDNDSVEPAISGVGQDSPTSPTVSAPATGTDSLDTIHIIATYPEPGRPLDRDTPTVWVMAAYQLFSAEEAELSLRLTRAVDESSGVGVASASAVVTQTRGIVVLPLAIEPGQPADEPYLNVLLRDLSGDSERLLFLDFPEGFSWPAAPGQAPAESEALFLGAGLPEPFEDSQLVPAAPNFQVSTYVAYTLEGYEQGMLTLAYELHTESSGNAGASTTAISGGQGMVEFTEIFGPEYFNSDGSLVDGIEFSVELSGYDESTGEYRAIYPQDAIQTGLELQERLGIESITVSQDAAGQPALDVAIWYERRTSDEAELLVSIEDDSPDSLAVMARTSATQTIKGQRNWVTISLPVDLKRYLDDHLFRVTTTLETAGGILVDELPFPAGALNLQRMNELWIVSAETITASVSTSIPAPYMLNLAIGYALDDSYASGMLQNTVEVQSRSSGGGGGGSGGGTRPIEPGIGIIKMTVPLNQPFDLSDENNWPEGVTMRLVLTGSLADGSEQELFTLERGPGSG